MTAEHATLAPPAGSDFYYATLYAERNIRAALWALDAFRSEISRIPATCSDPGVARIKLAWWREEVARFRAGEARHPVTHAFADPVFSRSSLSAVLTEAVDGVDQCFVSGVAQTPATYTELIETIHGGLWETCAAICGATGDTTRRQIRELGCRIEYGYNVRDLHRLLDTELNPLVADHLHGHGLRHGDLRAEPGSDRARALFAQITDQAIEQLEAALDTISSQEKRAHRVAISLARITLATLKEIARDGYPLLGRRIELTPLRKLWIAWRCRAS